jgi:hypothetical protein
VKKLPTFYKRFSDLLPTIGRWRAKIRKLSLGTAVTGMGALALGPTPPARAAPTGESVRPIEVAILNRDKRSPAAKLVLHLNRAFDNVMRARHGSHSSHASHASHGSHASHYSSSTGSVPSTPSPPYPSAPSSTTPSTSSGGVTPSAAKHQKVVIDITTINLEKSTISGTTRDGQELSFRFLPATKIRRLTPIDLTETLGGLRLARPNSFPLSLHQEVLVDWKIDAKTAERVAASFTIL